MKAYNANDSARHRLMKYRDWVHDLRVPLEGRRLDIVNNAFKNISGGGETFTIPQAKECFAFEGFDEWCKAIEVFDEGQDQTISRADFNLFYADISMGCFDDAKFIKLVEDTWTV